MYEELVKRLRSHNGWALNETIDKAADAIEELSAEVLSDRAIFKRYGGETGIKNLQEYASKYWDTLTKIPRWTPVTERLPEAKRKSYWVCTDTGYQCECRWTNNRFGIGGSDEWGWSVFDIPQYQKVVAWMSLPDPYEPPKEET